MRGMRCTNVEACSRISYSADQVTDRKFRIPNLQNGHAYLTSHRICYVDNLEPRKSSIAVELKSIEKYEFYVKENEPAFCTA